MIRWDDQPLSGIIGTSIACNDPTHAAALLSGLMLGAKHTHTASSVGALSLAPQLRVVSTAAGSLMPPPFAAEDTFGALSKAQSSSHCMMTADSSPAMPGWRLQGASLHETMHETMHEIMWPRCDVQQQHTLSASFGPPSNGGLAASPHVPPALHHPSMTDNNHTVELLQRLLAQAQTQAVAATVSASQQMQDSSLVAAELPQAALLDVAPLPLLPGHSPLGLSQAATPGAAGHSSSSPSCASQLLAGYQVVNNINNSGGLAQLLSASGRLAGINSARHVLPSQCGSLFMHDQQQQYSSRTPVAGAGSPSGISHAGSSGWHRTSTLSSKAKEHLAGRGGNGDRALAAAAEVPVNGAPAASAAPPNPGLDFTNAAAAVGLSFNELKAQGSCDVHDTRGLAAPAGSSEGSCGANDTWGLTLPTAPSPHTPELMAAQAMMLLPTSGSEPESQQLWGWSTAASCPSSTSSSGGSGGGYAGGGGGVSGAGASARAGGSRGNCNGTDNACTARLPRQHKCAGGGQAAPSSSAGSSSLPSSPCLVCCSTCAFSDACGEVCSLQASATTPSQTAPIGGCPAWLPTPAEASRGDSWYLRPPATARLFVGNIGSWVDEVGRDGGSRMDAKLCSFASR